MLNLFRDYYMDSLLDFNFKFNRMVDKPELKRKNEQRRNETCKCGSGKKYKSCCGK